MTNPPLDAIREELVTSLGTYHGPRGQRPVGLAGARPPARPRLPGHRQRRARQDRAHQRRRRPARLRDPRRARPLRRHRRGGRDARPARGDLRRGVAGDPPRRPLRRALRPRLRSRPRARSRRCCSPRPCTTTSSARRPAPRSACSSRPATCARCTTWRCSSASARRPSTPTSPWRPSRTSSAPARSRASTSEQAVKNLIKALGKGVLKVMSKMGISTVASYRGAQVFEAIGLSQELVDRYFTGTVLAARRRRPRRHRPRDGRAARAGPTRRTACTRPHRVLEVGGEYQWRREGEPHLFDPETVFRLQHSTRQRRYDIFKQYTGRVDDQTSRLMTLRGLMALQADRGHRPAARAARGGRAGQRDRQALQHRAR